MKIAAITAEYDPFHNGHDLLIKKAREAGAEYIVAVMSGNFVQRGEPALFRNDVRIRAALEGGVDLVIQLPVTYALSGAKKFAFGAVSAADALGCVDTLTFGSEAGDVSVLSEAARLLESEEIVEATLRELKKGISYASARENALRSISPACADVIRYPNNILGVEYISALRKLGSGIVPETVLREGAGHDSSPGEGNIASASAIRELIINGGEWKKYVPERVFDTLKNAPPGSRITDASAFETMLLYRLRTASAEDIARCPDVSEGLENRIYAAARDAVTAEEFFALAKTKRYSHARIRRIAANLLAGITAEDAEMPLPYLRVCGFGEKGAELLRTVYETAKLPVITKPSELKKCGAGAERMFALEATAGDIYALCTDERGTCGEELRFSPIIIDKKA